MRSSICVGVSLFSKDGMGEVRSQSSLVIWSFVRD